MQNRFLRLTRLQALSQVPRWSIVPGVPRQTVGEHTLNVALLVWWVMTDGGISDLNPRETTSAVMSALFHDAAECLTGDIPTPAKDLDRSAALSFEQKAVSELGLQRWVGTSKHPVVAFCDLADAVASLSGASGSLAEAVLAELVKALRAAAVEAGRYPGVSERSLVEVFDYATRARDVFFASERPHVA